MRERHSVYFWSNRPVVRADAELIKIDWNLACNPDAVSTGHKIMGIGSHGIAVRRSFVQVRIEPVSPLRVILEKPESDDKEYRTG